MNHQKIKTSPPLFTPEYTKINNQVIVKTDGLAVEAVTDDAILATLNKAVTNYQFQFLSGRSSGQGNITLETSPNRLVDIGTTFTLKITTAKDSLNIMIDSIYANSRWKEYAIHIVHSHISTTNSKDSELSAQMAEEIYFATGYILGQPPHWLNLETFLKDWGFGSVIVSFPVMLGTTVVNLFNHHCRFELAGTSTSHSTQCHQCQSFGHQKEHCDLPAKWGGSVGLRTPLNSTPAQPEAAQAELSATTLR